MKKNTIYFSCSSAIFFAKELKGLYEDAGMWPKDAIELTDEEVATYQGKQAPEGKKLGSDENGRPVWKDIPSLSEEELQKQKAIGEHQWVKSELNAVSIELMYHWTDDHRASHTEQAWKDYAIALRDYTSTDADGNPIMTGESRPSIDSYL